MSKSVKLFTKIKEEFKFAQNLNNILEKSITTLFFVKLRINFKFSNRINGVTNNYNYFKAFLTIFYLKAHVTYIYQPMENSKDCQT